ncbi:unnamed protein product [Fusarium venenatum]|uniref:Uncharacterized protein n=1 Tax=Fusarium venenatum TaxID=56646 RepID=A0A2L2STI8_9HYPO|nr:uncharacterized protein FVRRES_11446 [Fusarium venenatum]CEI38755.1 unnamed protein product [Fusarium venenatum]
MSLPFGINSSLLPSKPTQLPTQCELITISIKSGETGPPSPGRAAITASRQTGYKPGHGATVHSTRLGSWGNGEGEHGCSSNVIIKV